MSLGGPEYIKGGTDGTVKANSPISSPIRARARSTGKTPSSVPSVPIDDNNKPLSSKIDPDEHHTQRLNLTSSEARLLRQIHTRASEDKGKPVLYSEI